MNMSDSDEDTLIRRDEYLETALNRYFEENNLSLDESASSILVSPLVCDYVCKSGYRAKDTENQPYGNSVDLSLQSLQSALDDVTHNILSTSPIFPDESTLEHSSISRRRLTLNEFQNCTFESSVVTKIDEDHSSTSVSDVSLGLGNEISSPLQLDVHDGDPSLCETTKTLSLDIATDKFNLMFDSHAHSRCCDSIAGSSQPVAIDIADSVLSKYESDATQAELPMDREESMIKDSLHIDCIQNDEGFLSKSPLSNNHNRLESLFSPSIHERDCPLDRDSNGVINSIQYLQWCVKSREPDTADPESSDHMNESNDEYCLSPIHSRDAQMIQGQRSQTLDSSHTIDDNVLTPVDSRYSYHSHDLSSTKKQINVQSTLLMKQLTRTYQRRTLHLVQSQHAVSTAVPPSSCLDSKVSLSLSTKEMVTLSESRDQKGYHQILRNKTSDENDCLREQSHGKTNNHRRVLSSMTVNAAWSIPETQQYIPFKARPLPSSTTDCTGQTGVPKVNKRPLTIPKSPQLGFRRNLSRQDTNLSSKVVISPFMKKSFECSACSSSDDSEQNEIRENLDYEFPSEDTYLHGLQFLGANPHHHIHEEKKCGSKSLNNHSYPFTMHSYIRANHRREFETKRLQNEQNIRQRKMALLQSLIKKKQIELQVMKSQL